MSFEQLIGRYFRLQQELSIAYHEQPWHGGRIDRLNSDLATTATEIAALRPLDEQCTESSFWFSPSSAMPMG